MSISRREFVAVMSSAAIFAAVSGCTALRGESKMYGLIGKMRVVPGQRDVLISILIEGVAGMPGCLSCVVAQDAADPDAIWITEVWDSQKSHQASLSLPSVQQAISKGKPLIAGFGERFETKPIGGHGLGARG
jgi:quinol monooxygenase YgiN